jgi:hypothetical protein
VTGSACQHPYPEGRPDFLHCPDCGKRLVWGGAVTP